MTGVAVVTGGASGLGLATCRRLVDDGWTVVVLDHDKESLAKLEADDPGLVGFPCDVRNERELAATFATVAGQYGSVNAVVCAAGVLRVGALESMSAEDFDLVFRVNVMGSWLTAKSAIPFISEARARGELGRVVFLASVAALRHKVNSGAYAASKTAITALTRVLAVEVSDRGILVNAVAPGTVDTPMTRAHMRATEGYRASGPAPLGRHTSATDVASVISFLLGSDSSFVTGAVIPVDGGSTAALTASSS